MSGRTFGVQASWDEVLRLLDIDIPQSELNKAIGVADSMNQQIEEFLNRFVVSATNDAGDLTFDAAGTYTFEGDVAITGDLTLLGVGVIRTAASGVRAEMTPDAAFVGVGTVTGIDHAGVLFYTDDAAEDAPGGIGGGLFTVDADQWATVTVQSPDMGAPNFPSSQVAATAGPDISSVDIDANEFDVTLWNTNNGAVNGSFRGSNDTNGTFWICTGQQLLVDTDNAVRPFYSWLVDTDTGMFRVGANQLGFTANGTRQMEIHDGIVYVKAGRTLFQDGTLAGPAISFESDNNTGFYKAGDNDARVSWSSNGTKGGELMSTGVRATVVTDETAPAYSFYDDSDTGTYRYSANSLGWSTDGTFRWRIANNGQLLSAAAGSAGTPAFGWNSDSDTGLYRSGTNTIGFASGGSAAAIVNIFGIQPGADNTQDLGASGNRWDDVYATNGTIQTSDIREKVIVDGHALGLSFLSRIDSIGYRWEGGTRIHQGYSAQSVRAALRAEGLDPADHAVWVVGSPKDGRPKRGGRQGLRYSELIPVLGRSVVELAERVAALEAASNSDIIGS
jgi:hypothetical protein